MQVGIGKYYETRDGRTVGPMQSNPVNRSTNFPFGVPPFGGNDLWRSDGTWSPITAQTSPRDLIREVPRPGAAALSQPASSGTLKVEIGKYYADRTGKVQGPIQAAPASSGAVFVRGVPPFANNTRWTEDGRLFVGITDPGDLVREVPRPGAVPAGAQSGAATPASTAPAGDPEPEKIPKKIDDMRLADYRRGVAAVYDSFRLLP